MPGRRTKSSSPPNSATPPGVLSPCLWPD
jgi:hypothetical protein